MEALRRLGSDDLRRLASALRSGRLSPPFNPLALSRHVAQALADEVGGSLSRLIQGGMAADQVATMLEFLAQDRSRRAIPEDLVDLVWTGPETAGMTNRDTGVVVRELFQAARRSVLVAGYAVYQGREVFRTLADRMDREPDLEVAMYLDIRRDQGDPSPPEEVVRRFASRFRTQQWSGIRLPELYYDPRSLEPDPAARASQHAKCVVIDEETSLISSANFTEAAQLRNIEVGLLVRSQPISARLVHHFVALASQRLLQRLSFG